MKESDVFQELLDNDNRTRNVKEIAFFTGANNLISDYPDEDNIPVYSSKLQDNKIKEYTNNNKIPSREYLYSQGFSNEAIDRLISDSRKTFYYGQGSNNKIIEENTIVEEELTTEELNKNIIKEREVQDSLYNDYTDAEIYNIINRI